MLNVIKDLEFIIGKSRELASFVSSNFKNNKIIEFNEKIQFSAKENKIIILSLSEFEILSNSKHTNCIKIAYIKNESNIEILKFINNGSVDFIVFEDDLNKIKLKVIDKAISRLFEFKTKKELISELKIQKEKLEVIKGDKEKIIKLRTEKALLSKKNMELEHRSMSSMISFIKGLVNIVSMEDFLIYLKFETKVFHQLNDIFVVYEKINGQKYFTHFKSNSLINIKINKEIPKHPEFGYNLSGHRQFLANQLQRPLGKIISIPFYKKSNNDYQYNTGDGILLIEHSFMQEDLERFILFIHNRLRPISISFEKILLESNLVETAFVWEKTFDGIKDPVAIVNSNFELLRSNRHFIKYHKNKKTCYSRFSSLESSCLGCPLGGSVKTNLPQVKEISNNGKFYNVHSYPINLLKGESSTTVVNHYVDITKSKELQSRVIQNEKMSAIGHLAGNVAHELNNPLTGIKSMAEVIMLEHDGESEFLADLKEVKNSASRCQKIINNFLNFTKDEKENFLIVDLNTVIENTLPLLKTATSNFEQDIQLSKKLCYVKINEQLMQQVIYNIVNNACQAMGETGKLSLKTLVTKADCVFTVTDTGPGIEKEIITSIFNPFFTTKKEGEGTGLGLNLSKKIIESFNGDISVKSEVGVGTQIIVKLPLGDQN